MSDKKTICIPVIPGQDNIVECCINGKNYTIKRGEKVRVPVGLYDLLVGCGMLGATS